MAAWKSIECIIGAAVSRTPGTGSSLRLVIEKRILSPTRARMVGPGTWSPKVQALNFTPGAISMILCVVSSRTVFTGDGSSGSSAAPLLRAAPSAKAPLWRSLVTFAGTGFRSILATSYGSAGRPHDASSARDASAATDFNTRFMGFPPVVFAHERSGRLAPRFDMDQRDGGSAREPEDPCRTPAPQNGSELSARSSVASDGAGKSERSRVNAA